MVKYRGGWNLIRQGSFYGPQSISPKGIHRSLATIKDVKTIKAKGGTSALAKQLGKVSRACKFLDYITQGQM